MVSFGQNLPPGCPAQTVRKNLARLIPRRSQSATRYGDNTFAKQGLPLVDATTNFTAIAQDSYGRQDTNTVTVNLAATNTFVYDLNGNLTSDGKRGFDY